MCRKSKSSLMELKDERTSFIWDIFESSGALRRNDLICLKNLCSNLKFFIPVKFLTRGEWIGTYV
ncbi:hypothetical protein KUF71_023785 [Frankliniella fusca]|uniref:Uncharacterized protein n=1 Tax=Frankliniella fusca TaxID=407009 RepID=A0AAE1H419_9NEOP|nr:hypothetical protein KUF71_023785 [Frankliniella fusca]